MKKLFAFIFLASIAYGQSASYAPQVNIGYANSGAIDAFARLRVVTDYTPLLDAQNQYGASGLVFEDSLAGTADTNHVFNESTVYMLTGGTAQTAKAIRQSRRYFHYQTGKSQLIVLTVAYGTGKTNTRKRWGYFDANNGIFFQLQGDTLSIVKRSKSTGTIVDSVITQANWNTDKLNGTGSSGMNIVTSATRTNIYFIDVEWLGVGRVRAGIFRDGMPIVAHQFNNNNIMDKVYMSTANLPLRYEIENTFGVASNNDTLKVICASVVSEGGQDIADGYTFSANTDSVTTGTSLRRNILSIRPKTTLMGYSNRFDVREVVYDIYASAAAFYQIVYDGTLGGTPAWTDINATYSGMQSDRSGTSVTGGIVVASGYIAATNTVRGSITKQLLSKLPLTLNIAGTIPKTLSIVVRPLAGVSADFSASFDWVEVR